MLRCIEDAYNVKGRKIAAIARDMELTPGHVSKWFSGVFYIPAKRRNSLNIALGASVNWDDYDGEYLAKQEARTPAPAPRPDPAPAPRPEPVPPPAPQMPAKAPNTPAQAPRRLTATPPAKKPTSRPVAPPAAPAALPPARKGFFASLLKDDGDLFA